MSQDQFYDGKGEKTMAYEDHPVEALVAFFSRPEPTTQEEIEHVLSVLEDLVKACEGRADWLRKSYAVLEGGKSSKH